MPKNDDGEFELILGNRQLLSVFFIVVVLLGVFFTMGYIVGRNSGPIQPAEVAASPKPKPLVIDSPAPRQEEKPAPEPKAQAPEKKSTLPEPIKKSEPAPAEPPSGGGAYLQLTATNQHEAEAYADVLKSKGFKVITVPIPEKPGLIRVMVGPMPESAIMKTRADLTAAGFPGDKAIKR